MMKAYRKRKEHTPKAIHLTIGIGSRSTNLSGSMAAYFTKCGLRLKNVARSDRETSFTISLTYSPVAPLSTDLFAELMILPRCRVSFRPSAKTAVTGKVMEATGQGRRQRHHREAHRLGHKSVPGDLLAHFQV